MRHQHQQLAAIAILGANTLLDRILARLLKHEGYDTKVFEADQIDLINELHGRVDVVLLSPYLDPVEREALLDTVRSMPESAKTIPILSLSGPLQMALLDELSVDVSWQSLFEGLVQEIEATLGRTEETTQALPEDVGEQPLEGIPRSEAS